MRIIDADRLKDNIIYTCDLGGWIGDTILQIKKLAIKYIDNVPTIKTKQVKYYNEEESVWKIGEVIVSDSEKPNNCEPQTYAINPQEPTNDEKCFECDDFFTCGGQCNKIEDEPHAEIPEYAEWKEPFEKMTDCPWK